MNRKFISLLFLLFALSGCKEHVDEKFAVVPELLAKHNVPGVSIHIFKLNDAGDAEFEWDAGYGVSRFDTDGSSPGWIPVDPETTVYQAASIAKGVSSWALIDMINQRTQDPAATNAELNRSLTKLQYLSGCSGLTICDNHLKDFTPNDLINHRAHLHTFHQGYLAEGYFGLAQDQSLLLDNDDTNDYRGMPTTFQNIEFGYNSEQYPIGKNGKVKKDVFFDHLIGPYSSAGFSIIQHIMEESLRPGYALSENDEHRLFADYIDQRLVDVFGMTKTTFQYSKSFLNNDGVTDLASGYGQFIWDKSTASDGTINYEPKCAVEADCGFLKRYPNFLNTAKAAGGIYSTPKDFSKFLRYLVSTDTATSTPLAPFQRILSDSLMPFSEMCLLIDYTKPKGERIVKRGFASYHPVSPIDECQDTKDDMLDEGYAEHELDIRRERIASAAGMDPGFHSFYICAPHRKFCIVTMANSSDLIVDLFSGAGTLVKKVNLLWLELIMTGEDWQPLAEI